uniref:Uncharacterized protein n=1 Tax=Arundo donax TaxID=35708 RepID=A0A0A9DBI5_ARUDO
MFSQTQKLTYLRSGRHSLSLWSRSTASAALLKCCFHHRILSPHHILRDGWWARNASLSMSTLWRA